MGYSRFNQRLRLAFVSAGVSALVLVAEAWARAGGGGHFSGGGHSSGGGGHSSGGGFGGHSFGGGGGSGSNVDWFVVLIVIAIVIAYYVINALLEARRQATAQRGTEAADRSAATKLAQQLRQADPAFDEARFYQRVSDAFLKIQQAWSHQDLRPVQPFVSDGVTERFGLQFREQQALGYRNQMDQVRVARVLLANVAQGDVFEVATVRIDASAIDYEARLSDGTSLQRHRDNGPFTEYWTFLRRRGTASATGDGLLEGRCPNCGADIQISQQVTCEHCHALLRSGRYDWVLCEITQASEWRPRPNRTVSGWDAMRSADPELSTDSLEDRAAVIFWRRAEANRVEKPAVLRKMALDSFMDFYAAERAALGSPRWWFGEIGVGAIDVAGFSMGEPLDRAVVHVSWSGTRFLQRGTAVERGNETSVIRETFVLVRQHGSISEPDQGITSAHCPGCGAPVSSVLGNGCESCGKVLNDGSADWVLESTNAGWTNAIAAAPAPENPSAGGLLNWVIKTAAADGQIDAKERAIIERFALKAGVRTGAVEALIAAAQADRLDTPAPEGRDEVIQWLTAMIAVALVDGRLAKREAILLETVAARAGLGKADIRLLMNKELARQQAAGREALRSQQHPQ